MSYLQLLMFVGGACLLVGACVGFLVGSIISGVWGYKGK